MYTTLKLPIIRYGSGTWALSKTTFFSKKKNLRLIYGTYIDPQTGEWGMRNIKELQNTLQRPCISIGRLQKEGLRHDPNTPGEKRIQR